MDIVLNPTLFKRIFLLLLIGISFLFTLYSTNYSENHVANAKHKDCGKETNVIVGTRISTIGTECDDVIIGCPISQSISIVAGGCVGGDHLRGFEGDDVLQGSIGDDTIYGDEGKDQLTGAAGSDKLYGGPGRDILTSGAGVDLLVGGDGDDELYSGEGDDALIGGKGADFFDCGEGNDVIIDFDPDKGDTQSGNCEVVLTHNTKKLEIFNQRGKVPSQLETFGIGSYKDMIDVEDVGKQID